MNNSSMRCGVSSAVRRPATGLCVQQQRAAAPVEIGVQQHGMAIGPLAEMPGQVGRDGAGTDTAAHAGDRHDPPALQRLGPPRAVQDDRAEVTRHHVARDRLEQVFLHAEDAGGMPIEVDVVELADQQHMDIRFDDVRQAIQARSAAGPRPTRRRSGRAASQSSRSISMAPRTLVRWNSIPRGAASLKPSRRMLSVSASVTKATMSWRSGRAGACSGGTSAIETSDGITDCLTAIRCRRRSATTFATALSGSGRTLSFL